ncbi:hypothetical protein [Dokdonia pacifica]|uniref:Uncharacterized protein n=1 Tax=Dokdonia pacifica TaxID=1627892 RepID=A0A239CUQ0_9FLAO|nr:hypothetical protein [Dokdonia pacifica]SNS23254.1 hypothetical protein SAMN06265376_108175 [Dokdonia pacifica]
MLIVYAFAKAYAVIPLPKKNSWNTTNDTFSKVCDRYAIRV